MSIRISSPGSSSGSTYIAPGASLTGGGAREFGASPAVTLNWTATKNTNPITGITVNGVVEVPTGNTQSGTESASTTQDVNTTFNMSVTDGVSTTNASTTVIWEFRKYIGGSASATLNAAGIQALAVDTSLDIVLSGTYVFSAAATYKYFCCPDSFATPTAMTGFKDISTGFAVSMADSSDNAFYSNTSNGWSYGLVSVTNGTATPVTTNYRVYRSKNILNGAITIVVS